MMDSPLTGLTLIQTHTIKILPVLQTLIQIEWIVVPISIAQRCCDVLSQNSYSRIYDTVLAVRRR